MVTSSTSPRGAHHSTHAYLASFRSINSSCLIIRYRFQVVPYRGRGYSNSFVNPSGVYCYTHETIIYRRDLVTLQAGVGEDNFHNFYLTANSNPGINHLSCSPLKSPAGSTIRK